ncbi:MAG: riboflavin synthase [Lachnospiraceae bacterium]|nr:riboflavin synthase [Lachnospiraceae bacterium]
MFTGIVEEKGQIRGIRPGAKSCILTIEGNRIFSDLQVGDSVAVNGVCLTATSIKGHLFTADVMRETLERSSLGELRAGSHVNLERAMLAGGRFGGHIVSGHIDGTGVIVKIEKDDNAVWYTIQATPQVMKYIVEKGSVAIDGISLTVAAVTDSDFSVSIIPHTASETILSEKRVGQTVNLENDVIGKYVEKLLGAASETKRNQGTATERSQGTAKKAGITREWLAENGF